MQATDRINLRATPYAKAIIEQASQTMGITVSNFIMQTAFAQAMQIVQESKQIQLNQQEWQNALALLDEAPNPHKNMQQLFARGYKVADN